MPERLKQVGKDTLIPIGLVLTIMAGAYGFGKLTAQVDANTEKTEFCSTQIKALPSQYQYEVLEKSIDEIKADVKTLLKQ